MGLKAVFFLIFWLIKSTIGANETCSETKCKLIIDGNDLSAEFRSKSSEHGVRMVYLHLNVGNKSYNPLQSHDRFFPNKWTWARDVGEPMLFFSYQYQVLSLGLLKNQVRTMKVVLNDEPRGCLANLTSSCKDIVVSRTLLEKVTHDSNSLSQSGYVVCVSVVQRDMDWLTAWYYGNVDYRCCQKEKRENETMIQCDLPVKYNIWFMVFYHFLTFGIIFAFFYWPAVLIILPDYWFVFEQPDPKEKKTSSFNPAREIPVDDFSPNYDFSYMWKIKQHVGNRPRRGETTILKMFGVYYICILCFAYVFLALNYIFFLDIFIEFEAKHAVQENVIFYYLFDIRTNKLYCLIPVIILFVILPGNYIDLLTVHGLVKIGNLKKELRENFDKLRQQQFDFSFSIFRPNNPRRLSETENIIDKNEYYRPRRILVDLRAKMKSERRLSETENIIDKNEYYRPRRILVDLRAKMKTERNLILMLLLIICFHLISTILIFFGLFVLVLGVICCVVLGAFLLVFCISKFLFDIICFSPFSSLIKFIKNAIKEIFPQETFKYLWVPILVPWIIYFSLATILCCRFYIRMVGFVIMGLIINAQKTIAYATFIYVFISNISTSYHTFQNRYREVKKIIFKHYKKASSLSNVERTSKTIPEMLFWRICNEKKVLPFKLEATAMLVEMFTISSILFLALVIIVFFGEEYHSSPLVSGGAVLLSGKLTGMLFRGLLNKPEKFHGWDKIEKSKIIKQEVEEWIKFKGEDYPRSTWNDELEGLEYIQIHFDDEIDTTIQENLVPHQYVTNV